MTQINCLSCWEEEPENLLYDNKTIDCRMKDLRLLRGWLADYVENNLLTLRAIAWEKYLSSGRGILTFYAATRSDNDAFVYMPNSVVQEFVANSQGFGYDCKPLASLRDYVEAYLPERQAIVMLLMKDEDSPVTPALVVSQIIEGEISGDRCLEELNKRKRAAQRKSEEKELELNLLDWLLAQGVEVESQVKTQSHRLDLWIPGKTMLELKAGKVSGDDVCQAIDYYSTYQRSILLVGKGLTSAASRGIEGFNKSTCSDAIVFVTWNAVKHYLKAFLSL